jgi:predicted CoA-binding protein
MVTHKSDAVSQDEDIRHILKRCRTVAVVGLSPRPERDSHDVAQYMQAQGWRIVPVNPMVTGQILGEKVYPSLSEAARHERIELVNCFRNSADIPPIVDEAVAVGAAAVWMQLGVAHAEAAARARAAGLRVVQNRCLKTEHATQCRT